MLTMGTNRKRTTQKRYKRHTIVYHVPVPNRMRNLNLVHDQALVLAHAQVQVHVLHAHTLAPAPNRVVAVVVVLVPLHIHVHVRHPNLHHVLAQLHQQVRINLVQDHVHVLVQVPPHILHGHHRVRLVDLTHDHARVLILFRVRHRKRQHVPAPAPALVRAQDQAVLLVHVRVQRLVRLPVLVALHQVVPEAVLAVAPKQKIKHNPTKT